MNAIDWACHIKKKEMELFALKARMSLFLFFLTSAFGITNTSEKPLMNILEGQTDEIRSDLKLWFTVHTNSHFKKKKKRAAASGLVGCVLAPAKRSIFWLILSLCVESTVSLESAAPFGLKPSRGQSLFSAEEWFVLGGLSIMGYLGNDWIRCWRDWRNNTLLLKRNKLIGLKKVIFWIMWKQ